MRIYLSGAMTSELQRFCVQNDAYRLVSYAYLSEVNNYIKCLQEERKRAHMMIDSGAFTAWSKGKRVSLNRLSDFYAELLDKYSHFIDFVFISLDVIPGRKGVDPTAQELEEAMAQSIDNYHELKNRFGDLVIPVFHQGEDRLYYEIYKSVSDYVCISPRNDLHEDLRVQWAQQMQDESVKLHGLATTGYRMMNSVCWYSVDSAAWKMAAAYGGILYMAPNNQIKVLAISCKSGKRNSENGHFDHLSSDQKEALCQKMLERGFDIKRMPYEDGQRYCWNASVMIDYQRVQSSFCKPLSLF